MIPIHLAQSTAEIFANQRDIAIGIRESVETLQSGLIESSVFLWSSHIGMLFGGVFTGFKMVTAFKTYVKTKSPHEVFAALIYMFIIVGLILNTGSGSNLGTLSYGVGKGLNRMSEFPITLLSNVSGTSNIIEEAAVLSSVNAIKESGLKECLKLEKGYERDNCLVEVIDRVEEALTPYVALGGGAKGKGTFQLDPWPSRVLSETKDEFYQYFENPNIYSTKDFGARAFKGVSSLAGIGIAGWLLLVGSIFTYFVLVVQTTMIITAPILAGISFLTLFDDAFIRFIKNFILVSLGRMVFNLLSGLCAWLVLGPDSPDPILFPLMVAILSASFSWGLIKSGGPELIGGASRLIGGMPHTLRAIRGYAPRRA